MKFTLLYSLSFVCNIIITAQTINNGLFVNEERNEFVIIKNDTIQFRIYNDDAFATFTIGEGVVKKKGKSMYLIETSPYLTEKTSILYRRYRNDDSLSIIFKGQDSLSIAFVSINMSRLLKKPFIKAYSDEKGQLFLEKTQIDFFDKNEVLIHAKKIGYTEIKKNTKLESGYDYIIQSLVPTLLSGSIARGIWEIRQLSEEEISISNKKNTKTKLKKITSRFQNFDFPFDKDVNTILYHF